MSTDWIEELQVAFEAFQTGLIAAVRRAAVDALQPVTSVTRAPELLGELDDAGLHAPMVRPLSAALCTHLVELVRQHPGSTAKEIAQAAEVPVARIRRYLDALVRDGSLRTEPRRQARGRRASAYFDQDASAPRAAEPGSADAGPASEDSSRQAGQAMVTPI